MIVKTFIFSKEVKKKYDNWSDLERVTLNNNSYKENLKDSPSKAFLTCIWDYKPKIIDLYKLTSILIKVIN